MKRSFYSNGKLLLTGEYLVLDGAQALAIPTRYGQQLTVENEGSEYLHWQSFDNQNTLWFEGRFALDKKDQWISLSTGPLDGITKTLLEILTAASQLNPDFNSEAIHSRVTTSLDFPRDWGLGTSSTLLNNVAQWAQVDAFKLLDMSFGGSGYDIACAQTNSPLFYKRTNPPEVNPVAIEWSFKDELFFVFLGQKMDSKKAIAQYRANERPHPSVFMVMDSITQNLILAPDVTTFVALLEEHEAILSSQLNMPTIKETLFSDYTGLVKSLGAWGGDFVLSAGGDEQQAYFKQKGYDTIIPYSQMILK